MSINLPLPMPFTFVMLGAQKSASSFLHLCVSEHPDVFMPHGECPFFESPDYRPDRYADFASLFDGCAGRLCGFRRATYLGLPEVPGRLHQHAPRAMLIAVLRNPFDRCLSSYYHNVANGFIPALPFEKGMERILHGNLIAQYPRASEILEFSRYKQHLQRYRSFFPDSQILCLLHDDCVENPLACVRRIYRFLGISEEYSPMALTRRPQAVVYSLPRLRWRRITGRLKYTYNESTTRLEKKPVNALAAKLLEWADVIDRELWTRVFPSRKPLIESEMRRELTDYFLEDIRYVEQYLGRDLSSWT